MKIGILAGEISGDNYASILVENFKRLKNRIYFFGTGGDKMRKAGVDIIEGMPFGKMGFSSPILSLPQFFRYYKKVIKKIKKEKPDLIIYVDNPGFNLKVAKSLDRKFPSYYYIPPKIWAHNYKRVEVLKKYTDGVIPIFPFEVEIYKKADIPCWYFGHPVIDLMEDTRVRKVEKRKTIGILPGSRIEEVKNVLPYLLKILKNLKEKTDFDILISSVNKKITQIEKKLMKNFITGFEIIENSPYRIISESDVIWATSGTVNLEVFLCERPLIVFYKTSILNYFIAKFIVNVKMISPVNLILQKKIVPEFIQKFPSDKIEKITLELFNKKSLYSEQAKYFKKLKEIVGEKGVSEKIAKFLLENVKGIS